jgi:hypothetical protein
VTVTSERTTILDGARLLARHGGIVEARIPHTPRGTVSGYFDSPEALALAVERWDGKGSIYVTANPVLPDLLARANNRLKEFARNTTKDKEIVSRAWFLVDLDPARVAGSSSTDIELTEAIVRRDDIIAFLREMGFPEPATAMSGNGGHALYAVDLTNADEVTRLFERALKALSARFSDNAVALDKSVFNPARIWKLYGTVAVKGDATPERPHRRSVIEHVPSEMIDVEREALERLAAMAPNRATYSTPNGARHHGDLEPLDLIGALQFRGLYLRDLGRGRHAVTCPWAPEHSGNSGVTESCVFELQTRTLL